MSFIQTKIIQIVYFYHKYHESLLMTIRINITIMIYLNEFHCWIHFRLANRYGLIMLSLKLEHTGLCSKNHLQCTISMTTQWYLNFVRQLCPLRVHWYHKIWLLIYIILLLLHKQKDHNIHTHTHKNTFVYILI